MRKCPFCNSECDVAEVLCPACGREMPAPYETAETEDDGYDQGDFANPLPVQQTAGPKLVDVARIVPEELAMVTQQLANAGLAFALHPDPQMPGFRDYVAQLGGVHILVREEDAPAAWQVLDRAKVPAAEQTILSGAEIIIGEHSFNPGTIVLARGKVLEILNFAMPDPESGASYIDLSGYIISAGFIDLHIHGLHGIDATGASAEQFAQLAETAAEYGIIGITPTTYACSVDTLASTLAEYRTAQGQETGGAHLLGLHLESNFISPEYAGAQPREFIFAPNSPEGMRVRALLQEYADVIEIVTLAPELPGAMEVIAELREKQIVVSLGHSGADYNTSIAAIEAGATMATHIFNRMPALHHRAPGLLGAALERDEIFAEFIADGQHLHPAIISMLITAKGGERCALISDALPMTGMGDGPATFAGQTVTVRDGAVYSDDHLMGSATAIDGGVRTLVETVGWDLGEALALA
ncbi:MAG: N-acetylglucosamine-6-phosphate deacetylase, partial [bacterium]